MDNKFTFTVVLSLFFGIAVAQESTNSSGGLATGSGGSASYSVGQVAFQSFSGGGYTELQGVQQPLEVGTVTNIFSPTITNKIVVYPNPTKGILHMQIDQFVSNHFTYQVMDAHGKVLESKRVQLANSELNFSNLPAAAYFLKITKKNGETKTFRIVKNN